MAAPSTDNLLREIDEDLRRERYAKLWKRYGVYIIAAAFLLIAAVAGYQIWQTMWKRSHESEGERFAAAAALVAKDPAAAERAFQQLAGDASPGYALLARLQQAALIAKQGDHAAAYTVYQQVAGEVTDPLWRDLAIVLAARQAMAATVPPVTPEELQSRLKPIAEEGNPWRYSARETLGLMALQAGDKARAREWFQGIVVDPGAPEGMRSRTSEILSAIGDS